MPRREAVNFGITAKALIYTIKIYKEVKQK